MIESPQTVILNFEVRNKEELKNLIEDVKVVRQGFDSLIERLSTLLQFAEPSLEETR